MKKLNTEFSRLHLSSQMHTDALGFFCHREAAVGLTPDASRSIDIDRILADNPTRELRAKAALEWMAYIHEMRHLHDVFGTVGGMNIFFLWTSLARQFANVVDELQKTSQQWQLPLTRWLRLKNCPSIVREFVHRAEVLGDTLYFYIGKVEPRGIFEQNFRTDEIYRYFEHPRLSFRCPYYAYRWRYGNNDRHSWVPIGLEALAEGSAHAIQRTILSLWPEEVASDVHSRLYAFRIDLPKRTTVLPLPYNFGGSRYYSSAKWERRPTV